MFWALEAGRVDARGFELEQVVSDIQTLNEWALEGRLEVTAISLGAYPHVADRYVLLPHGASMGSATGRSSSRASRSTSTRCASSRSSSPGRLTTAYLVLAARARRRTCASASCRSTRSSTRSRRAAPTPGSLIHEGQLTYGDCRPAEGARPRRVVGAARPGCRCRSASTRRGATSATGSRDALGACSARRSASGSTTATRRSPTRSGFGRGIDRETADRFVAMYVNELTRDYGEIGRRAVDELLRRAGSGVTAEFVAA